MKSIVPQPPWTVKEKMRRRFRQCCSAGVRIRYLVVFNLWNGRRVKEIETILAIHNTTIYRIARRYRELGEASLWDGREDNGREKLSEHYLAALDRVVRSSPLDHGWLRPTWTREMLVETLAKKLGVRIHVATMSRALASIKARRGRPKPTVRCPLHPAVKTRRLNQIRTLLATLPRREAAVYEDEVDIHLNPKIGLDWMGLAQQKEAVTPGKNEKRYLAGALDVRTGEIHWVEAERKDSWLFLAMLKKLTDVYAKARVIHVILDNYGIHSSNIIGIALSHFAKRVRLHFLPPYCPDHNRIERAWQDLHANVTRNHRCPTMRKLMNNVRQYLSNRNETKRLSTFKTSSA